MYSTEILLEACTQRIKKVSPKPLVKTSEVDIESVLIQGKMRRSVEPHLTIIHTINSHMSY